MFNKYNDPKNLLKEDSAIRALYNKIESARKEKARKNEKYVGPYEREINMWIKYGQERYKDIPKEYRDDAISFVYAGISDKMYTQRIELIIEFLEATQDSKYCEVAKHLKHFKKPFTADENIEIAFAVSIFEHAKDPSTNSYAIPKLKSKYYNAIIGKCFTLKKELKQVMKQEKEVNSDQRKKMRTYKNIYKFSKLSSSKITEAILKFLNDKYYHKDFGLSLDDVSMFKVRDIVIKNQNEACLMIAETDCLDFVNKQKVGKIK